MKNNSEYLELIRLQLIFERLRANNCETVNVSTNITLMISLLN